MLHVLALTTQSGAAEPKIRPRRSQGRRGFFVSTHLDDAAPPATMMNLSKEY